MRNLNLILWSLILVMSLLMNGCSSSKKLEIPKPDETAATQIPYEIPNSSINVGLTMTWVELAKQINASMPVQILDDKDFNADGLKVNLKKTGDVGITYLTNQIQITVPLNARVWYRYGIFGSQDVKEFRMQGTVYLLSHATIEEMAIKTKTRIERIVWEQNPTLVFYGKNVPMGFVIDPIISSQSSNIASGIDGAMKKLLDFKPLIKEQMDVFRNPILLSEEFKMWLQITPSSLVSSPLRMNKDMIVLDLSMNTKLKTTLGTQPTSTNKLNLSFKSETPSVRETQIKLPVETSYQELSKLFTNNLKGTPLYEGKKKKVVLDSIALWHSEQKLVIGVQTSGAVKGWIYLRGVPKYNSEKSELYLDELDYHVNTKNVLVKSMNWLLSGKILKMIQDNSRFSLKKDLDNLKKDMVKQLNGYKPMESVLIKFKLNAFDFEQIHLTNASIVSIFDIKALIKTEVG